ncbi:hypothetical protein SAMN05444972_10380 [Marininema halotolerans]|uniref:Uncharacterized protein n=1 Tax=Marininema halotolerans TaxID=1155944 RepID=A0A1I6QDH0_9BACL|nr:hypothetical protein SAMN05444972_10380 [Marininema halotolerans]
MMKRTFILAQKRYNQSIINVRDEIDPLCQENDAVVGRTMFVDDSRGRLSEARSACHGLKNECL